MKLNNNVSVKIDITLGNGFKVILPKELEQEVVEFVNRIIENGRATRKAGKKLKGSLRWSPEQDQKVLGVIHHLNMGAESDYGVRMVRALAEEFNRTVPAVRNRMAKLREENQLAIPVK